MATLQSTATRRDYISAELPDCYFPPEQDTRPTNTHSATSSYAVHTYVHSERIVIDANAHQQSWALLGALSDVSVPEKYYQAVTNEASVVDAFVTHAMVPTLDAAKLVLQDLLSQERTRQGRLNDTSGLLEHYNYKIFKRPQQKDNENKLRKDHYITLEAGSNSGGPFDPKATWSTPKEFKERLISMAQLESKTKGSEIDSSALPKMVLLLVEEKAAGLIVRNDWDGEFQKDVMKGLGHRNVYFMLPQLIKYSFDAKCPYVLLTDYKTSILVYVEKYPPCVSLEKRRPPLPLSEDLDEEAESTLTVFPGVEEIEEVYDGEEEEDIVEDEEVNQRNTEMNQQVVNEDGEGAEDKEKYDYGYNYDGKDDKNDRKGDKDEGKSDNNEEEEEEEEGETATVWVEGQRLSARRLIFDMIVQQFQEIDTKFIV